MSLCFPHKFNNESQLTHLLLFCIYMTYGVLNWWQMQMICNLGIILEAHVLGHHLQEQEFHKLVSD